MLDLLGAALSSRKTLKNLTPKRLFFSNQILEILSNSGLSGRFWSPAAASRNPRERSGLCDFFKRCRLRLCAVFVVWFLNKNPGFRCVLLFFWLADTMQTCSTQTRVLKKHILWRNDFWCLWHPAVTRLGKTWTSSGRFPRSWYK